MLSRSLAGWLYDPRPRTFIDVVRHILFLGILWPFVTNEPGYVSEDDHPHPVWNLLIFHGAVVEHVGNDHRFQQTDDHEGQTHGEIDTCIDRLRTRVSDNQLGALVTSAPLPLTYDGCAVCCAGQQVVHDEQEHGVAKDEGHLEGGTVNAVWRQVER